MSGKWGTPSLATLLTDCSWTFVPTLTVAAGSLLPIRDLQSAHNLMRLKCTDYRWCMR